MLTASSIRITIPWSYFPSPSTGICLQLDRLKAWRHQQLSIHCVHKPEEWDTNSAYHFKLKVGFGCTWMSTMAWLEMKSTPKKCFQTENQTYTYMFVCVCVYAMKQKKTRQKEEDFMSMYVMYIWLAYKILGFGTKQ